MCALVTGFQTCALPICHRPQRAGLRPGGQLVHLRQHEALDGHFLRDAGQGRVLLRARREGGERLLEVAYSHSSAPFFHSYTKPTVRIPRKIIIDQKPIMPMSPRATAQGNRRSEEHTSELQSLMRISYAVFCLKKNNRRI